MDLEWEYNNTAKVPGSDALVAAWPGAAAAFRAAHPDKELDVSYGPSDRQKLDIFWPRAGRDAPMAMFVHGGYWQRLDRSFGSHLAAGLLAHGVAVAMPSYDLCPAVTVAQIVDQLRGAAAFLHARHAKTLLATGHSAGGHLAAMLLAAGGPVTAAMPISGLFDLPPLVGTSINHALGLDEAEARRLSPLFFPRPGGRIFAYVGGDEGPEYHRQSSSIATAWGSAWQSLPGKNHFTVVDDLRDPDSAMVRTALDLIGPAP